MKTCQLCLIEKAISEFHPVRRGSKQLRKWCKECTRADNNRRNRYKVNNKGEVVRRYSFKRETFHQYRVFLTHTPVEELKDSVLRKRYGISLNDYKDLLAKQGGVCDVCGRGPGRRSLHVDHCHSNGKVRALLCGRCNSALGNVGDSIEILYALIDYLRKHQEPTSPTESISTSEATITLHSYAG